jgi:hypothetical protein
MGMEAEGIGDASRLINMAHSSENTFFRHLIRQFSIAN